MRFKHSFVATIALLTCAATARASVDDYRLERVEPLVEHGGRVSWSPDGEWIAYDRKEADGLYDVHLIRPDGTDRRCLTCDHPGLPDWNKGQPEWHPGGRYLVIEVEMQEHGGSHDGSAPGAGIYNDLYVLDLEDGGELPAAHQLTFVRDGQPLGEEEGGVLHSAFSHDGSKLLWTDMQDYSLALIVGDWQLAIADFVTGTTPHLASTDFYNPGPKPEWFEAHGFGPEEEGWVYFACTPFADMQMWNADICRMDLDDTSSVQQLTFSSGSNDEPAIYDEHAKMSPLEDAFVWASDAVVDRNRMELFMANLDGSGARRITYFNQPGHEHETGFQTQAWDSSWNPAAPEGTAQLAVIVVHVDQDPKEETIKILHFEIGDGIAPGGDAYEQAERGGCGCRGMQAEATASTWLLLSLGALQLRRRQ